MKRVACRPGRCYFDCFCGVVKVPDTIGYDQIDGYINFFHVKYESVVTGDEFSFVVTATNNSNDDNGKGYQFVKQDLCN